jgi:hypothetical protein
MSRFTENHAQTATCLVKHKQAQAVLASTREVGCTATAFEIHDATRYKGHRYMHTQIRSCIREIASQRGNSTRALLMELVDNSFCGVCCCTSCITVLENVC